MTCITTLMTFQCISRFAMDLKRFDFKSTPLSKYPTKNYICTGNLSVICTWGRLLMDHSQGPHRGEGNRDSPHEKQSLRNVRVSTRSGPVRPGSSYNVYQFELLDHICFSIIIPPKSRLAEIIYFATQVWAIARVSALSPKIHFIFHLFHQDLV
jgi:hypothetical protein